MVTVVARDETTSGDVLHALELQLRAHVISVAELITARVRQEVRDHNTREVLTPFTGLVQPTSVERELNDRPRPRRHHVDAEIQTAVALRAFERGNFLLLVDDLQVDRLDAEVMVHAGSQVSFLRLVPLVGG